MKIELTEEELKSIMGDFKQDLYLKIEKYINDKIPVSVTADKYYLTNVDAGLLKEEIKRMTIPYELFIF
jgi:hypothetical protein